MHSWLNTYIDILAGDTGNYFAVDPSSGTVSLIQSVDFEQISTPISLVVQASDGRPTGSATASLDITITDITDESPSCTTGSYVTDIDETTADNTLVSDISRSSRNCVRV